MEEVANDIIVRNNLTDTLDVNTTLIILEDLLLTDLHGKTVQEVLSDLLGEQISVSEQCLHLAVSTPRMPTESPPDPNRLLPVVFFIYGGGFIGGTQLTMGYERLGDVNDFVLVAINYRTGSLGFMCLDTPEAAGNMGLLDQIVALEWVQRYIPYFGGDPNRVRNDHFIAMGGLGKISPTY